MSCAHCDDPFYARDPRQLYCSPSCRVMACRKRRTREQWAAKHWLPDPVPEPMPWRFHEVPVAIVAHPSRLVQASIMGEQIFAEAIVVDDKHYGCEVNHLRAWEWLAGGNCPWSVVIEDDAVPIDRFRHQLHAVLQAAPTPIVSLYLGRQRPPHWQHRIAEAIGRAKLTDACFLEATALLHGVGYAIRSALLPDLLAELPSRITDTPIDEAITAWARERDHLISYTWPSLLDHRDGPSLAAHHDGQPRRTGRTAWYADGREHWTPTLGEIAEPERVAQREEVG